MRTNRRVITGIINPERPYAAIILVNGKAIDMITFI